MKFEHLCSIFTVAACLGHPQHATSLLDQRQKVEMGAARIIHTIRGAEQTLAKDLRGHPKFLISEERLLHKASLLALKAGKMRAKQIRSGERLKSFEEKMHQASSVQNTGAAQMKTLAHKEAQLLRGGRGILREVHAVKQGVENALGQSAHEVTATIEHLMDRVGGAQRDILASEAAATGHASKLAASIRAEKAPVFAQASVAEISGTKDPKRRMQISKKALADLAAAKTEVSEAYGTDDGTAQKVAGMIDQLEGSLQGLQEDDSEDMKVDVKAEEAAMFANIERDAGEGEDTKRQMTAMRAKAKSLPKKVVKASLIQHRHRASAHSRARAFTARKASRRFRQQSHRLQRIMRRTKRLALNDRRISKETKFARRVVDKELGNTAVGEEVEALLAKAASSANHAAWSERHVADVQKREVRGLANMAAVLAH